MATLPAQDPDRARSVSIAAEPDYPPYSYVDETGTPTGFAVELFRAVAERMKLDLTVRSDYWAMIKDDLAAGRIDALPLVGRTPEREEYFDFTVPFHTLYGGIVVREGDERIESIEDVSGKRVAVMAGDNAEEFLRRRPVDYEIVTFPTFVDALADLESGRSDAVVMQRLVALRILQREGFTTLRLVESPVKEFRQDFCFAVTEGDKDLLAILNDGLSIAVADGTVRRLQTKWFSHLELPSRTIIVGGDANYPPFEFLDERGRPTGYNVELVRAIAREMGFDVEVQLGTWTQMTGMLERGEIDLLAGMLYSPARDTLFDFSPSHTVHQNVAVGRRGARGSVPSSPDGLRGHTIAVQAGDLMHGYAIEHGLAANLVVAVSQEEALERVIAGEADYALGSRITALYLIERNGWDDLIVGRRSLVSEHYAFGAREGNAALLSYFAEGLAVIESTGEYRRIYDRWLGVYVPPEYSFAEVSRTVLLVLAPIVLVLAAVVVWNWSLRTQVARSTAALHGTLQRKQWLTSVATSYLARADAWSLIAQTTQMLADHFPEVRVEFLSPSDPDGPLPWTPALVGELSTSYLTAVCDVAADARTRRLADGFAENGVGAFAAAAVRIHGDAMGFLTFLSPTPRVWTDHELVTLEEHGNLLTLIAENETYERMTRRANASLRTSLEEKETLLKEVHHRVKNNLNVIVSLLRLQEDRIDSVESAREAFDNSRNRIFAMALVHESLYNSEDLTDIELDQYIRRLVEQLSVGATAGRGVRFVCDLEPVGVEIETAIPCGIIINELITNAHKHAFVDSSAGEITVRLSRADRSSLRLTVSDNGVGVPDSFAGGSGTSLGLKLVDLLAAQLDGKLTFTVDGGTTVDLVFPVRAREAGVARMAVT